MIIRKETHGHTHQNITSPTNYNPGRQRTGGIDPKTLHRSLLFTISVQLNCLSQLSVALSTCSSTEQLTGLGHSQPYVQLSHYTGIAMVEI